MSIGFVGLVTYSSNFWFSIFVKTSSSSSSSSLHVRVSLGLKGLNGRTPRLN